MSRKAHATGFRLGITQDWSTHLHCYNRLPISYSLLALRKLQISNFLKRFFYKYNIILSKVEWDFKNHLIQGNLFYTQYKSLNESKLQWISKKTFKEDSTILKLNVISILRKWLNLPFVLRFYRVHWLNNPETLSHWICLQLEQQKSVKLVIQLLKKELTKNKDWDHKIKRFVSGEKRFYLRGVKIICSGRLGGKRNRLSSRSWKQIGVMPLQNMYSFLEYSKKTAYTRFGKIGVHVYYYYAVEI